MPCGQVRPRRTKVTRAWDYSDGLLAAEPDDVNLHYFYAQILDDDPARAQDALAAYRRCLSNVDDPSEAEKVRRDIISLELRINPTSEAARRKVLRLRPGDDAASNNSVAWMLYTANVGLEKAEQFARHAHALSPDDHRCLHTLAAILMRRGDWNGTRPIVTNWISALPSEALTNEWFDFGALFHDAVSHGVGEQLATLVNARNGEPWACLSAALRAAAARHARRAPGEDLAPAGLVEQLLADVRSKWPPDAPVAMRAL